jgi:hypothetical protein
LNAIAQKMPSAWAQWKQLLISGPASITEATPAFNNQRPFNRPNG